MDSKTICSSELSQIHDSHPLNCCVTASSKNVCLDRYLICSYKCHIPVGSLPTRICYILRLSYLYISCYSYHTILITHQMCWQSLEFFLSSLINFCGCGSASVARSISSETMKLSWLRPCIGTALALDIIRQCYTLR